MIFNLANSIIQRIIAVFVSPLVEINGSNKFWQQLCSNFKPPHISDVRKNVLTTYPLLISTSFLKYPLELKKKFQLVYNWIFILVWNECRNGNFKKPVEINRGLGCLATTILLPYFNIISGLLCFVNPGFGSTALSRNTHITVWLWCKLRPFK